MSCIRDTMERDLKEEIGFIRVFDGVLQATMQILDMPDQRASLLVRLILQNQGKLSKAKRKQFSELTDSEIQRIEGAVRTATQEVGRPL